MQITNINVQNKNIRTNKRTSPNKGNINFKASFVTLAKANSGEVIEKNIVQPFNNGLLKEMAQQTKANAEKLVKKVSKGTPGIIKTAQDLVDKVNVFSLAAGKGSRFEELAIKSGNEPNKVAVKFPINEKEGIHMLDFPLAANKMFAGEEGHQVIMAEEKSGTMGDIIKYYLEGNEIKDTVIRCGDNIFGNSAEEMTEFITKTVNTPNKHLALVGVERTPEEAAERFGVLKVTPHESGPKDIMRLEGFEEKPPLEKAKKLVTPNGKNIANTGMLYFSKEAMTKLVDKIKAGDNPIKKNDVEKYDFAFASKYILKNMEELFGVKPSEGADVKVVKKWEDVGEPKAYYNLKKEMGEKGDFLQNFPKNFANKVKKAVNERTQLKGDNKAMLFDHNTASLKDVSKERMDKAPEIDGVKIIAPQKSATDAAKSNDTKEDKDTKFKWGTFIGGIGTGAVLGAGTTAAIKNQND